VVERESIMSNREIRLAGGTIEDHEAVRAWGKKRKEEYEDGMLWVTEPITLLRRSSTRAFTAEILRVRVSFDGRGDEWSVGYQINLIGVPEVSIEYNPAEVGAGEFGEVIALLRDARSFVRQLARLERRVRR
jgi:hypothetical protein